MATQGYVAVDLDGTLAQYDGWQGPGRIGPPVPRMLLRVHRWLARGEDVRIFTARVGNRSAADAEVEVEAIKAWCREHVGRELPITATKDYMMRELWDDRCVQVIPNTGRRADGNDDLR